MMSKNRKKVIESGLAAGFLGLFGFFTISTASALTYQQDIPVSFTFNRSISVSVSSDLHIYNLTPGTAADSNIITVSVATNNITGYVLTASVGNNTHSNPSYNNTNLNHTNGSTFTTVATNASLASLTSDNTWGYSTSTDNGSTWSNYSGLPLYTAANWKELANVNSNGTTSLKFKIGAKASAAQPSGDYTNVINFTATTNYVPYTINNMYYMQDFGNLDSAELTSVLSSMTQNTQYTLKDSRDQQDYTITKLSDGNVWMTKNLNLAGGTTVTPADSNTSQNYVLPESSTAGFNDYNDYVYNSNSTLCSSTSPCYSYYSRKTSGSNGYGDICPKGWKLPSSTEINSLINIYTTGTTLTAGPFLAVYAGYYKNSIFYDGGSRGGYWSSSHHSTSGESLYLSYNSSNSSISESWYHEGFSIRCIVKQ